MRINIAIIILPLAFSIVFYEKLFESIIPFFGSFLAVGIPFILWDSLFYKKGVWSFNEKHVFKSRILGLPFEEILFFISAPFSCLFIFKIFEHFFVEKMLNLEILKYLFFFVSFIFIIVAFYFREKMYTFVVFLVSGLSLFLFAITKILFYYKFLLAIAVSFLPFLIFNGILTYLPVVRYNSDHIIGIRIYSIPVEDFFYNFSMLGWYFFTFDIFSKIL
jgi:lycopene cyclase domain-containing protein